MGSVDPVSAELLYGLTQSADGAGRLIRFSSEAPGEVEEIATFPAGELGAPGHLDFEPATGRLFAIQTSSCHIDPAPPGCSPLTISRIDHLTGELETLSTIVAFANPESGFDFDSATGQLRFVSYWSEHLRYDIESEQVTPLPYLSIPPGGLASGIAPGDEGSSTFVLNRVTGDLFRLGGAGGDPSADTGVVTRIGSLGLGDNEQLSDLDISPEGNTFVAGSERLPDDSFGTTRLYLVDLSSAAASLVGAVAVERGERLTGIAAFRTGDGPAAPAIPSASPFGLALLALTLVAMGWLAVRRRPRGRKATRP